MATFRTTTKTFGPAPVSTVVAAMEAYIEGITTLMAIRAYRIVECHRDNQVMGVIVHDTPLIVSALLANANLPTPTVVKAP